jgi:hypothetical protein
MEVQVPRLAIVPFQGRMRAGARQHRVDKTRGIVHALLLYRGEDLAKLGRHEAERGRVLPGRRLPPAA